MQCLRDRFGRTHLFLVYILLCFMPSRSPSPQLHFLGFGSNLAVPSWVKIDWFIKMIMFIQNSVTVKWIRHFCYNEIRWNSFVMYIVQLFPSMQIIEFSPLPLSVSADSWCIIYFVLILLPNTFFLLGDKRRYSLYIIFPSLSFLSNSYVLFCDLISWYFSATSISIDSLLLLFL